HRFPGPQYQFSTLMSGDRPIGACELGAAFELAPASIEIISNAAMSGIQASCLLNVALRTTCLIFLLLLHCRLHRFQSNVPISRSCERVLASSSWRTWASC